MSNDNDGLATEPSEAGHSHTRHDHDHPHDDEDDLPVEKQGLWLVDNLELRSAGIDIGSSGTRVAFSRLKLRRNGIRFSSQYEVVSREVYYQSDVKFTPYTQGFQLIDEEALSKIVRNEYSNAGVKPDEIDTGVVILTGEATRRQNSEAIASALALRSGKFVTFAAGHNQEALLAAHGSGAVKISKEKKLRILNLDIGGGTTKFSLIDHGEVIDTCALAVGGRLIVHDNEMRLVRLEPSAEYVSRLLGIELKLDSKIEKKEMDAISQWMAESIIETIFAKDEKDLRPEVKPLLLTPFPLELSEQPIQSVVASGGVGEYVYGKERRSFNDLGKSLGEAIKSELAGKSLNLLPALERIRATVIGVSEYTVQLSGNTIYISDESLLPLRNLRVIRPNYKPSLSIVPDEIAHSIARRFEMLDMDEESKPIAIMLHWNGEPSYERLSLLAEGISKGVGKKRSSNDPLVLILDQDVGSTVGSLLRQEKDAEIQVVSIDGILLQDFDFVDIGSRVLPAGIVPVTVKSLAFAHSG